MEELVKQVSQNDVKYLTTYSSPIGELTLASDGENLCGLWLDGQKYHGAHVSAQAQTKANLAIFSDTKLWLKDYFNKKNPSIKNLPLASTESEFRRNVANLMTEIPYGKLSTYGELAKQIEKLTGKACAPRPIGGAVGHNTISIIVPCHRVVGTNGSITGYAGGIKRKLFLLELEGVDTQALRIPQHGTAL